MLATVGGKLLIQACGRTCQIEPQSAQSVMDVQAALQQALGMHDQEFDLCDKYGARLCTDMSLTDAVARGHVPLQATLSDASVHYIENKREELAQMQWKVLRDKLHLSTVEIQTLQQQVAALMQRLDTQQRESESALEVLRSSIAKEALSQQTETQAKFAQMSERINSVMSLISGETSKREFSHQNLEHRIQDLRSVIDSERAARMKDYDNHNFVLKDGKIALEAQVTQMENNCCNLEERLNQVISDECKYFQRMNERQEQMAEKLEKVSFDKAQLAASIESNTHSLKDLEIALERARDEARSRGDQDVTSLREEIERSQRRMALEYQKQISELEVKVTERLEFDSNTRESNTKQMFQEITKAVSKGGQEDSKSLGDDTATLPSSSPMPPLSRSPNTPRIVSLGSTVSAAGSLSPGRSNVTRPYVPGPHMRQDMLSRIPQGSATQGGNLTASQPPGMVSRQSIAGPHLQPMRRDSFAQQPTVLYQPGMTTPSRPGSASVPVAPRATSVDSRPRVSTGFM
eukprot:TRINITY_DN61674_c0_g1_i1.p1 TRINITY_DN61674_c0_g1~~TRINITY_DN61674_c0_g1_i1.p1  ORF type:complete len:563 (-),score=110.17 TRINITY_DN61674_c0_g1_i1:49-1605(-)